MHLKYLIFSTYKGKCQKNYSWNMLSSTKLTPKSKEDLNLHSFSVSTVHCIVELLKDYLPGIKQRWNWLATGHTSSQDKTATECHKWTKYTAAKEYCSGPLECSVATAEGPRSPLFWSYLTQKARAIACFLPGKALGSVGWQNFLSFGHFKKSACFFINSNSKLVL